MNDDDKPSEKSFSATATTVVVLLSCLFFFWRRRFMGVVRSNKKQKEDGGNNNNPHSSIIFIEEEGPMIRYDVESVVKCLYERAMKRWSLSVNNNVNKKISCTLHHHHHQSNTSTTSPSRTSIDNNNFNNNHNQNLVLLKSQVGGISSHKSRMIKLDPSHVLKPLRLKDDDHHRGIREIGFYEAVMTATATAAASTETTRSDYIEFTTFVKNNTTILTTRDNNNKSSSSSSSSSSPTNVNFLPADDGSISNGNTILRFGQGILFGGTTSKTYFSLLVNNNSNDNDNDNNNNNKTKIMKLDKTITEEINLLRRLNDFIPKYYGVFPKDHDVSSSSSPSDATTNIINIIPSCPYLVLQDLTRNFSKPCTIDIKIGTHTYEPDAPTDKKVREQAKYPLQIELGFRIVGFRIYDPFSNYCDEDGFIRYEKSYGRSLSTRDEVKRALIRFLCSGGETSLHHHQHHQQSKDEIVEINSTFDSESASIIISSLTPIRQWFVDNRLFRFCASSILIVYEGDDININSNNNNSTKGGSTGSATSMTGKKVVDVKLIDFARVRRDRNGDPGSLLGIKNVISLLEEILQDHHNQQSF